MYETKNYHLIGVAPTILCNGQMSNPLNEFAKELKKLTSKKPKTDEDYREIMSLEWHACLYINDDGVVCWPGENIEAMLLAAAKKFRQGPIAKAAILVADNPAIIYDGPKDIEKLWADERFRKTARCVQSGKTVWKTRPIFNQWELKFAVQFNPEMLDERDLDKWMVMGGQMIGLSDWRPRHGRFQVKGVEYVESAA